MKKLPINGRNLRAIVLSPRSPIKYVSSRDMISRPKIRIRGRESVRIARLRIPTNTNRIIIKIHVEKTVVVTPMFIPPRENSSGCP